MSDKLPTPVEIHDYLANDPPVPMWMQDAIVAKYAADGFVDREAIDTRAAYKVYEDIAGRPELTYSGFLRVFAAAIGNTK